MDAHSEGQLSGILEICDKDQLNKYLNDEGAVEVLIKTFDQYQSLVHEKENLKQTNRILAEANLAKQPELEQAKQRLKMSMDEFESARKEYMSARDAYEAVNAVNGDMSLQSVLNLLHMSAQKAEEETDKSADDFFCEFTSMHTEEEVNLFQRQFLENRTLAHVKKIKADKMKELLPSNY